METTSYLKEIISAIIKESTNKMTVPDVLKPKPRKHK